MSLLSRPERSLRPFRRSGPRLAGVAVGLIAALTVAGCTGQSASSETTASLGTTDQPGGVVTALSLGPILSWDPQRIGSRADAAFAGRTFMRTLTAYQPSQTPDGQATLVGDLATDTGTPNTDLTTWTFTLRPDITWQDGSPVTCEDVVYGISRTFATTRITGGDTDALAVLAVPKRVDGTSTYAGPYATGKAASAGQAAFDKAITCAGSSVTFHLAKPTSDFNEMVSMPAFAPYKAAEDLGSDGSYVVFSDGPYQLKGAWEQGTGGTFVRNPAWKAASDPVRKAYPDEIRYQEGMEPQTVAQDVMTSTGSGSSSIALDSAPPAIQQHIAALSELHNRSVNPATGLVEYLVPNFKSPVFAKPEVRKALAMATNREAYVIALGGDTAARPTRSLIPAALPAATGEDPVGTALRGDPAAAKALLEEAGVKLPVTIRVAYRSTDSVDKAMAALVEGWQQAGFEPELQPIVDNYFTKIADPRRATQTDVFWSNWAPQWASASTILPPLFDSTINLTAAGPGRDYGYFADKSVTTQMSQISRIVDRVQREKAWGSLDASLRGQGAYIGLAERRAMYVAGSDVRNFTADEILGGSVDFGVVAVHQ